MTEQRDTGTTLRRWWWAAGAAALLIAAPAWADEPAPPEEEPAPAPEPGPDGGEAEAEGEEGDAPLPGLDELLGLEEAEDDADREAREEFDPSRVELERKLTNSEAADRLSSAVQQMHETAHRLESVRDTGVVTQRLQEEILVKLEVLIRDAEQSSSSASNSSSSESDRDSEMRPGGEDSSRERAQTSQQMEGGTGDGVEGTQFEEGQVDQFEAVRAAWGALPERVRERLMEGSGDYFSATYRLLTEAYYRRIAEEATK